MLPTVETLIIAVEKADSANELLTASDSPSLKPYWEQVFLDCYATALKSLRDNPDYQSFNFPNDCPFPQEISQILQKKVWR